MDLTPASTEMVVRQLAAWSAFAREAFATTTHELEDAEIRALKQHLARQHKSQRMQLDAWLSQRTRAPRNDIKPPAEWKEVTLAMASRSKHVVLTACALLERAVLAAYERAADVVWLEASAHRLVRRHQLELRCCRDHYLTKVQRNSRRSFEPAGSDMVAPEPAPSAA